MTVNDLRRADSSALSPNLSHEQVRQAWRALRDAGQALAVIASAALGEGNSVPGSPSLAPAPGYDHDVTVNDAIREFLRAKARAGRSDRYLRQLLVSLRSFAKGRAGQPINTVAFGDVEKWLEENHWAARTRKGYLADVRTLFNFALKRGFARQNPAAAVETPVTVESDAAGIHTPRQVTEVLEFARQHDLNICRCLAVRYFAGLRSSEATALEEKEIGARFIEVTAIKSKTRRRRLVTIQPNLRAWLDLGGVLPLNAVNNRLRWFTAALLKAKGIQWPNNVTRHSFVSYHLAAFENAGKTALEAGHAEQMLFAHYRELVTPDAAKEFWKIVPAGISATPGVPSGAPPVASTAELARV
jgi:integrase